MKKLLLKSFLLSVFLLTIGESFAQQWRANLPTKSSSELTLKDYQKAFNVYWGPYNIVDGGWYIDGSGVKRKAPGYKQFKRPTALSAVDATVNPICVGDDTDLTYTGGSGATFAWYSTSCGVGAVGTGDNYTVSPGATITYYGRWENSCGNSTCQSVTVTVNDVPAQPSAITGNASLGIGTSETYSVTNVAGVTYTWSVPGDWSIDAGQTTNSIDVTVGSNSGNVSVTPSNSCGDGSPRTLAVTPAAVPISWDGSTDNDWQTTSNWTPEQISTITDNVIIPTGMPNYPVINDGIGTIAVLNKKVVVK